MLHDEIFLSSAVLTADERSYGNKAAGLLGLQAAGCRVPAFYLIAASAVGRGEEDDGLAARITELETLFNQPAGKEWVVRSSTLLEDGESGSHAGLFHSELHVKAEGLAAALRRVKASYGETDGGIIIQEQIDADYAGVLFTRDPLQLKGNSSVITLTEGTGERLVAGEKEGRTIRAEGRRLDAGTAKDLPQAVVKALESLVREGRKLERRRGLPLDIEFCIRDGQLYWLQARPITTLAKKEQYTWDNANIGDNFPGLSLPLTISYVRHTYAMAYAGLAAFVGMSPARVQENRKLFEAMAGGINGALYYNVTAWQLLLSRLPFRKKTMGRLTKIWDMKETASQAELQPIGPGNYIRLLANLALALLRFRKREKAFREGFGKIYNEMDGSLSGESSPDELERQFNRLEDELSGNWVIPVLNGLLLMLFYGRLTRLVGRSRLAASHPGVINDVIASQMKLKSAELIEDYLELLRMVQQDYRLVALFESLPPEQLPEELKNAHPRVYTEIMQYIENYGERIDGGELKIEIVNYREDPLKFLSRLRDDLRVPVPQRSRNSAFDFKAVLRECYPYNPLQRRRFTFLFRQTGWLVANREDHRFLRLKGYHLVRRIFREMDSFLLREGHIEKAGDSLYLDYTDLFDNEAYTELKDRVRTRKEAYAAYEKEKIHHRYIQEGELFVPDLTAYAAAADTLTRGLGCCRGQAEAEVVHYDSGARDIDYTGKIVVARYIEPVAVCKVSTAAGIIMERGNLLSHTAILCRELGIPSVVGAKHALELLHEGERLIINGSTGEILREHEK